MPDIHAPYHDQKAINAAVSLTRSYDPHRVIFLGDVIDAQAISSFKKIKPFSQDDLQRELDSWVKIAKQFRQAAPKARLFLIPGNHDLRLVIWQYGTANVNLRCLALDKLLSLKELEIQYVEQEYIYLAGKTFVVIHGDKYGPYSGSSAAKYVRPYGISGIIGHSHRACIYYETIMGKTLTWVEAGHLSQNPPPYKKMPQNWQHAITIGEFPQNTGPFAIDLYHINDGKIISKPKFP